MLFNCALVSSCLFASAVLAHRRCDHDRPGCTKPDEVNSVSEMSGAILEKSPGTFNEITGTFTIPYLLGIKNTGVYTVVGIDGASCGGVSLRGGVRMAITDNGISYRAFSQWYPDDEHYFSDIPISPEDTIRVSISTVLSDRIGLVIVENLSNGKNDSVALATSHTLCGQDAAWLLNGFTDDKDTTSSLPVFDRFVITDAVASGYTPEGAVLFNVKRNHRALTNSSINGSSVIIQYL